jgi:hypothetical protein
MRHESSFHDSVLPATDDILFNYASKVSTRKQSSLKEGSLTDPTSYRDRRLSKKGTQDWMQVPLFKHLIEHHTWIEAINAPEADIVNKLNSRCCRQVGSLSEVIGLSQ